MAFLKSGSTYILCTSISPFLVPLYNTWLSGPSDEILSVVTIFAAPLCLLSYSSLRKSVSIYSHILLFSNGVWYCFGRECHVLETMGVRWDFCEFVRKRGWWCWRCGEGEGDGGKEVAFKVTLECGDKTGAFAGVDTNLSWDKDDSFNPSLIIFLTGKILSALEGTGTDFDLYTTYFGSAPKWIGTIDFLSMTGFLNKAWCLGTTFKIFTLLWTI